MKRGFSVSVINVMLVLCLAPVALQAAWEYRAKPADLAHEKDVAPDTVNRIIQNFLVASGQKDILYGDRCFRLSGSNVTAWDTLVGVEDIKYSSTFIPPNKGYSRYSFYKSGATRTVDEVYDGSNVWVLSRVFGAPRVEEESFASRAGYAIRIFPSLVLTDPNLQPDWIAYRGKEMLGNREMYRIEFGYVSLENIQLLFDAKTFLLMEIRSRGSFQPGGARVNWRYRIPHYTKEGAYYLPAKSEVYIGSTVIESIVYEEGGFSDTWDEYVFTTRKLKR
ncbi:hypothetical protein [Coraliomargarita parva]|uniref:hypothetical protein n=1 Tax=Coraliomargarita parva TaxID=3014050 RepID=UPI0022B4ACA9|nr:hypothetical protein [Coraliomargarita parva]